MGISSFSLLTVFLSLFISTPLKAELFQLRDQNPLILGYGLPLPSISELPADGRWQGALAYNLSNTLNIEGGSADASDYLLVDGETTVFNLQFLRGWGDRWAWGVHLPLIRHGAGQMDGFIENYHDAMGLPEGNRPGVPQDRMAFIVRHEGKELLNLSEARSGIGDVGLLLAYQWSSVDGNKRALHAQLKLPTGDADHLTGSGGVDYANWLTVEHPLAADWAMAGYFGFVLLGKGDILPTLQRKRAFFGGGGLEWSFSPAVTLRLQADMHTGFYKNTGFQFLDEALILNMGGSLKLTDRLILDIAVGEDIMVGTSPDVSFHTALRLQW
jgi:hypothetical protein